MISDTVLKCEGMRILSEQLGLVEAERFIFLISSEQFDYTKWQRTLFSDISVRELSKMAMECQKNTAEN